MSPVLVLLLIVNLLACPVRCLSRDSKAAGGEDYTPAACSCCQHCDVAPSKPEPFEDECDCQNCICQGAVLKTTVELPDAGPSVSWRRPLLLETIPVAGLGGILAPRDFSPDGQLGRGRDRCVAHQSWLI